MLPRTVSSCFFFLSTAVLLTFAPWPQTILARPNPRVTIDPASSTHQATYGTHGSDRARDGAAPVAGFDLSQFGSLLNTLTGGANLAEQKRKDAAKGASTGAGLGGSQCEFTCADGHNVRPRASHKPYYNGCGSYGIKIRENFGLEECCNAHDICYSTCMSPRENCDIIFNACMAKKCELQTLPQERKRCTSTSGMFYLGTTALGCGAYLDSQREACECFSPDSAIGSRDGL